jgi:membrane protease YdiL (CAAX protease family)
MLAAVLIVALVIVLQGAMTSDIAPPLAVVLIVCGVIVSTGRAAALISSAEVWPGLYLGAPLGVALYLASTGLATRSPATALASLAHLRGSSGPLSRHGARLGRQLLIVTWEECLWRGTVLFFLGPSAGAVVASSAAFAGLHFPGVRKPVQLLDLFVASVVLCVAFLATRNILVVAIAHWLRNALILFAQDPEEVAHAA